MEHWKEIPNSRYEASDEGRIRRKDGLIFTPSLVRGHEIVCLRFLDRRYQVKVHTLVCLAFNGVKPTGAECVRHLDGNKLNNTPSNLRWGTNKDNAHDTILHGRQVCGFDHPNMIIKKDEARTIREIYKKHMEEQTLRGAKKAKNGTIHQLRRMYPHLTYKTIYKAATGAYDGME